MDDADRARARRLYEHLAATAELPVERTASRWLGEAEAVAADAAREDVPETVVATRAGQVVSLLSHVEETGHPDADDHLAAAREVAAELVERLEEE